MFSDVRFQRSEGNMPLKASLENQKTYKVLDKTRAVLGPAEFTWVHLNGLPHSDKPGGKIPN